MKVWYTKMKKKPTQTLTNINGNSSASPPPPGLQEQKNIIRENEFMKETRKIMEDILIGFFFHSFLLAGMLSNVGIINGSLVIL